MAKIYIAGQITGNPDFVEQFTAAQKMLESEGHLVMNPAVLGTHFSQDDYMHISRAMIDVCEESHFLPNWKKSYGANYEMGYSVGTGKVVKFIKQEEMFKCLRA